MTIKLIFSVVYWSLGGLCMSNMYSLLIFKVSLPKNGIFFVRPPFVFNWKPCASFGSVLQLQIGASYFFTAFSVSAFCIFKSLRPKWLKVASTTLGGARLEIE
jgi:hypothetical protein